MDDPDASDDVQRDDLHREVFHSRFNRMLAVATWLIDALLLGSGIASGILSDRPQLIVPAALVGFAAWAGLWRPAVVVDDEAVILVNVVGSVTVPWAALIEVDTKYALALRTPGRVYSAWAAPAPGRAGAAMAGRRQHDSGRSGASRPGDLLASESGEAAYLVRTRWTELLDAGRVETGVADTVSVQRNRHLVTLAVLVVLATASAFALGWA